MKKHLFLGLIFTLLSAIGMLAGWPSAAVAQTPTPTPTVGNDTYTFTGPATTNYTYDAEALENWTIYQSNNADSLVWVATAYGLSGVMRLMKTDAIDVIAQSPTVNWRATDNQYTIYVEKTTSGSTSVSYICGGVETDISGITGNSEYRTVSIICNDELKFAVRNYQINSFSFIGLVSIYATNGNATIYPDTPTPGGSLSCSTVDNFDFDTSAGWQISNYNTVSINSGVATIDGGLSEISQQVNLNPESTYNAVISVTEAINPPIDIIVSFDGDGGAHGNTITIDGPGIYNAEIITPYVYGPVNYKISNIGNFGQAVSIDYTCLNLASYNGDTEQKNCIAPDNGDFAWAILWDYFNGASHTSAKEAFLPYNTTDKALLVSQDSITLPTIADNEYLLMSFDARAGGDGSTGYLGSAAASAQYSYEIYQTSYNYEADLSSQAGQPLDLRFVNSGSDNGGFSALGDVYLDNICIWVADRGPNPPGPVDISPIRPIDFGISVGCGDTGAILAGFGINLPQAEALASAGSPSIWDPSGWVPYMISNLWVLFGRAICFTLELFNGLMSIIEYSINAVLNVLNWMVRSTSSIMIWFGDVFDFIRSTAKNIWLWTSQTASTILQWIKTNAKNIWAAVVDNAQIAVLWLSEGLLWLWGGATQLARWVVEFLLRYITEDINNIIAAWNLFIAAIGNIYSTIIQMIIDIWDGSIVPILQYIFDYTAWAGLWAALMASLMDMMANLLQIVFALAQWLWAIVSDILYMPMGLLTGFNDGLDSASYDVLSCSSGGFICYVLAGFDVINTTVGPTVLYPMVIVGIILVTINVFGDQVKMLWHLVINFVRGL